MKKIESPSATNHPQFGNLNRPARKADPRRRRVAIAFDPVSKTQQQFKDECDVNNIVAKHAENGTLEEYLSEAAALRPGSYGDFSDQASFMEAQEIIIRAQSQFDALPAKVRERFQNDPAKFLAFMEDENNADEAFRLGLLQKVATEPEPDSAASLKKLDEISSELKKFNSGAKKGSKTDAD